ncbi:MAG: hypothetical protein WC310_04500 [Patescibacteria group bacterium]|jgi:hypothetical protein
MENKEVSIEISSCVDFSSGVTEGRYFNPLIERMEVEQFELNQWGAKNRIKIFFPTDQANDSIFNMAEEFRSKLVSLFVLISNCDVSARDEIVLEELNGNVVTEVRRGDEREIKRRIGPLIKFEITKSKISEVSELEWNALKRFKETFLSIDFSKKLESLFSAIDTLAKNDFSEAAGVRDRMEKYLLNLNIPKEIVNAIPKDRGLKIHENTIPSGADKYFASLRERVADDFAIRFGVRIQKSKIQIGDQFQIIGSKK